ncbi:hypothetical protein BANRA_02914 [Acinetobacter baumannii]|nr:hypothetical protein BANRA_02592 [Acinetobacter baumannii]VCX14425.1 hypothetical protein BANRA_02914 [Acinetobacter baumannii]
MDYIDPRFKLTKEQFIQIGKEAAEIWQKKLGKPILFMILKQSLLLI